MAAVSLKGTVEGESTWSISYLPEHVGLIEAPPQQSDDDIDGIFWWWNKETGDIYKKEPEGEWVNEGPPMPPGSVPPGDGLPPPKVTGLVVTPLYRAHVDGTSEPVFELAWDSLIATVPDILGYEVWWGLSPADWVLYQSMKVGVEDAIAVVGPVIGGTEYDVRVRAYDNDGYRGPWSDVVTATALGDTEAPDIPTDISAIGGYGLISVYWPESPESDLAFYEVRARPTDLSEDWSRMQTKSNRITISDLALLTSYDVQVRAVDRSGNVKVDGDPDYGHYLDLLEEGWSETETAITTQVGAADVAVHTLAAEFVWTGLLDADRVRTGDLSIGGGVKAGNVVRYYSSQLTGSKPIAAQGEFGLLIVDLNSPGKAMHIDSGVLRFSDGFDHPSVVDDELELGIPGTVWTTAIDSTGINAEAITFGAQFGGNNRALNAGFELQDFDIDTRGIAEYTDVTDWGTPDSNINMDVSGAELRMVAH